LLSPISGTPEDLATIRASFCGASNAFIGAFKRNRTSFERWRSNSNDLYIIFTSSIAIFISRFYPLISKYFYQVLLLHNLSYALCYYAMLFDPDGTTAPSWEQVWGWQFIIWKWIISIIISQNYLHMYAAIPRAWYRPLWSTTSLQVKCDVSTMISCGRSKQGGASYFSLRICSAVQFSGSAWCMNLPGVSTPPHIPN
jgi:hypothetical protein